LNNILLSICIPTYNRLRYLRELLPSLLAEVATANLERVHVELLISNNASTDGTEAYLQGLSCSGLSVYSNEVNIGGDRNFLACVERASGSYVWLFGDDEVFEPGGLNLVLAVLNKMQPSLLILRDGGQGLKAEDEVSYTDYGACVREEMKRDNNFALAHTLITSNIFLKEVFDLRKATSTLHTNYAHMYGLLHGMKRGGCVAVKAGVFRTRPQRAQFDRWPIALCVKQAGYLWRLAKWFDVPRLRRFAVRLALNLPVEVLGRCVHQFFPRLGGT
jgi:glycosyltransferase involved in cell wall biosynthesis